MNRTILLVDDDTAMIAALRRELRHHGFLIHTADSATQALKMLREDSFQVVISDLQMPGMDGLDFLASVKQHWPQTVRLLMSGQSQLSSQQQAKCAQVVDKLLAKPWCRETLIRLINAAFSGQLRAEQETTDELSAVSAAEPAPLQKTQTADNSLTAAPELFDVRTFDKLCQGVGHAALPSLLAIFSNDTQLRSERLNSAIQQGDNALVKRQLHTIGSSSALYGLMRCSAAARKLEQLCDSDLDKVSQHLPSFNKLLEESLNQLPAGQALSQPRMKDEASAG